MDALQNPARVEAAFREQLLPVVISVAVHSERERKPWDAVRAALALSPGRGACELLLAAARAGIAFQLEVLLEIVNVGCGGLPVSDLIPAAEALLPHRDNIRAAEAFDAHMKRLVADGSVKLSNSLQETVEAQRTDAVATDSAFAGMSRTLRRIAQSGKDHWSMISELHQALDDRFAREGISVGFNENREFELQHLTRPEWIIRTLNCFLCGCENSGSLHRQAEMGIPLVEYFDEVGIAGCARALRAIEGVMKEEEARVGSVPDDELYGDSYYARLEAVEREAEGMEECCRQLWRFALRYREEILRVD